MECGTRRLCDLSWEIRCSRDGLPLGHHLAVGGIGVSNMPCAVASHSAFLAFPPLLAKGRVQARPFTKVGCTALERGRLPGAGSACGNWDDAACVNTVEPIPSW